MFDFLLRVDEQNNFTNTAIVINDKGEIIHRYDKMNPWIPFEGSIPGRSCTVCDGPKGAKLGIIICADGDYPEMWREAAVQGANVIIRPTHYMDPWQNAWEITNKSGAYFNQVYVVAVNCSGTAENEEFFLFWPQYDSGTGRKCDLRGCKWSTIHDQSRFVSGDYRCHAQSGSPFCTDVFLCTSWCFQPSICGQRTGYFGLYSL